MDAAPAITIVLPTFNRRHVLERTLPGYQRLAARWPLLVIDDGSHDGTAEWLRGLGITVIRVPHRGLPAARNAGLHAARTPWVLFGEDDVLMPVETPAQLLAWAARLPRCAAVAPRLHNVREWELPAAQPAPSPGTLLDLVGLRGDFAAPMAKAEFLPSLHACALVDRAAVLAVGGYDTAFAGSHFREESDTYARLWRAGRSCWLVPDAWAIHVRHRLGGGCRSGTDFAHLAVNRLSYLVNDARFGRRHGVLWRRWGADIQPGGHALRAARKLVGNLVMQAVSRF